ncbi:prolipoprotein diacylglyceryl transferase [Actinophytocola xanthii]|uniref:Uncharacterized protein n=1 Tax=Actinophytocola xanthii TaxID=1912961 RepID=A0A1Q8CGD5_9PSEU|nr:hypothetical protein [Actinophytocola xanthii]OLF13429.1 hypothetical protein BU204_27590 [Actinophytocola xanthii]
MIEPEQSAEIIKAKIRDFASELAALRGELTYPDMEKKSGCPHEKLKAAAGGETWPEWATVHAYVTTCGGEVGDWRAKWETIDKSLREAGEATTDSVADGGRTPSVHCPADADTEERPKRSVRTRRMMLVSASVVVLCVVATLTAMSLGDATGKREEARPSSSSTAPTAESSSQRPTSATASPTTKISPKGGSSGQPSEIPPSADTVPTHAPPEDDPGAATSDPNSPGVLVDEDPGRHDGVQEKRVVELTQEQGRNWVDIEYWRQDASTPGELQISSNELFTNLGAKIAVIPDTPLANRSRCAQATGWRDRIAFSELHVGSQLCGLSRMERYASIEVRVVPDAQANGGRLIFYGITWY